MACNKTNGKSINQKRFLEELNTRTKKAINKTEADESSELVPNNITKLLIYAIPHVNNIKIIFWHT